jgi:hypothetical protein
MTTTEIYQKYPVRNKVWGYCPITGRWITEASELKMLSFVDPWNRPFPITTGRLLKDTRENETIGWVYETTVSGVLVECVVFND